MNSCILGQSAQNAFGQSDDGLNQKHLINDSRIFLVKMISRKKCSRLNQESTNDASGKCGLSPAGIFKGGHNVFHQLVLRSRAS